MYRHTLDAHHIQQWRGHGYTLVHDMLDVGAAQTELFDYTDRQGTTVHDFGNDCQFEFPSGYPALDAIPLHPTLLQAASDLLNCSHVLLHQAVAWTKHGDDPGTSDESSNSDHLM